MKLKRIVAFTAAIAVCASLCACTDKKTSVKKDIDLSGGYPIDTDVTLTYWLELTPNVSATASNMGDTEFAKGLAERTGVKVEYLHPAVGQQIEAFNLMVASGDLPDIIEHFWLDAMPGAPDAALQNEVIIPINDLMKEYAPNLTKYLNEHPNVDRAVKTDDGTYYTFPFAMDDTKLGITAGIVFRKDWLDELGLDVPSTVEEWEEVLVAFRDKKGATAPLTLRSTQPDYLYRTLGSCNEFYLDETGKVNYGIYDPNFKRALQTLNKWYKEGLLDKNYTLNDSTILDSNMLNGISGATFASGGSGVGKWLTAKKGEKFDLVGAELPTIDGKPNKYGLVFNPYNGYNSASISTKCAYPELAAKYLDYLYGEEGHMYANFGVEGVSYEMIDGYPTFTELITKNPEGLSMSQAMAKYSRAGCSGAMIQDVRYIEQYYELPSQKEALDKWSKQAEYAKNTTLPLVTLTMDESSEFGSLYSDIKKYCDENIISFITGSKSFSEWDKFVKEVENMDIKRCIEIKQAAYTRYMSK